MGSEINIGKFTERITVWWIEGETTTELGAVVKAVDSKELFADARQLRADEKLEMGMSVQAYACMFTFRDEVPHRVSKIDFQGREFNVVTVDQDKKSRFLIIRAVAKR
jgi:head-tail adaptor